MNRFFWEELFLRSVFLSSFQSLVANVPFSRFVCWLIIILKLISSSIQDFSFENYSSLLFLSFSNFVGLLGWNCSVGLLVMYSSFSFSVNYRLYFMIFSAMFCNSPTKNFICSTSVHSLFNILRKNYASSLSCLILLKVLLNSSCSTEQSKMKRVNAEKRNQNRTWINS